MITLQSPQEPIRVPSRISIADVQQMMRFSKDVCDTLRDIRQRLIDLGNVTSKSGLVPISCAMADTGIAAGSVLHVKFGTSPAAFLATAATADAGKYATHICTEVFESSLTAWRIGTFPLLCLPFTYTTDLLYLSTTPGRATDNPEETGSLLKQVIAVKESDREDNAICQVFFQAREFIERA